LGELQLLIIVNCIVGLLMGAVVTERKQAEVTLAIQARVASIFGMLSDEEMFNEVLKVVLEVMHSPFGIFGYIDDNEDWVMPTMTRQVWDTCQVPGKSIRYPPETWGDSSWPRALREKRTICSNEPSTNIPKGHVSIQRHISMPILFQGEAIGLFQVANKETDYTEADIRTFGDIAEHVAPLLSARLQRERAQEVLRESEKRFLAEANQSRRALLSVVEDQNQAQEALRTSEAELRALFAGMTDMVIVYNADGRYIKIAPTNPANLYRPLDDMLGKTVHDILPKEQANYIVAKIGEAIQTGQIVTGEYTLQTDGKEIWFASSVARLSENTAIWVAHDITNRKQAEEQIQRQVETLGALYDLSRKLSEMEDFDAILDLVTRRAVEGAHVTFARVLLLEQDDLVARAAFPVRVLDHALQVGQREPLADHPTCQRILEENTPLILQVDSPEAGDCAPFFLGIAQTLCIVPLHVHEHPFGLLMLGEGRDAAREPFTADKIRLASSIGDQAASTLHRALLHKETVRQLDQLQALHNIDQAIAASMDLRITLNVLLEHVLTQLKVDAASVLLLNPHLQTLEYAAGRGFHTNTLQQTRLRLNEGYAGRAALERKLVHIPDLRVRKTDFLRSPFFSAEGFVAYYSIPLIAKGQVKGVLEVFHRAPLDGDSAWLNFFEMLAGQAAIAIDNAQLFDYLQRSNMDLALAYDATIEGWSHALDLRDRETEGHTLRVTETTERLARAMGMSEEQIVHIHRGALLHDIGKMGVPDGILLKPDKLTDEEWVLMRKHPQFAFDLLAPITYLKPALDIPYCHHEKWDGTGYPRGLKGEQIPLTARLFAVVDVWDALRSDRPYREAWPEEKVLEHIKAGSGTHFDPKAVELFFRVVSEKTEEH
jgi:PAS domain S-box-containing protein